MIRSMLLAVAALLAATLSQAAGLPDEAPLHARRDVVRLPGLHAPAVVLRDVDGVPHVQARDEHDALFMQGYLHANDRLFQLDYLRRVAGGTLAELLGEAALPTDVQLRTLGVRRAAALSLAALTPRTRDALQAYTDGINAWVARHRLPREYAQLQLSRFKPWEPLDSASINKLLLFQLSFEFDVDLTLNYLAYQQQLGQSHGAEGAPLADALFFQDVFRMAPLDPAATVPDAQGPQPPRPRGARPFMAPNLSAPALRLLRSYREQIRKVPELERVRQRRQQQIGSNLWAVSGAHTRDGRPLVANDPHLSLGLPANFHDMQLQTQDGLDVIGSAVPGTPFIVLGQNRRVAWGSTATGFDVTDAYEEQVVPDAASPSGLSTLHQGRLEPVTALPVTFRVNLLQPGRLDQVVDVPPEAGLPPAVLIVPRHGPIVQLDLSTGTAISMQWAGFSATREIDAYARLTRARNLPEFKDALQLFDAGTLNFVVGDIDGHIGYFGAGEMPLREDLQAGTVNGAPPWLVRNGRGGNEWIRKAVPGPTDGTGYEVLPFAEMPQVVDPPAGFFVNANNDPAGLTLDNNPLNQLRQGGNGILYLGASSFDFGTRAGRITQVLRQRLAQGRVDRDDMAALQADVTLLDAQVLVPAIVRAFDAARTPGAPAPLRALAADPRVVEAAQRLRRWGFNAPTGLANGYDAADPRGLPQPPGRQEIEASVAATIYSVWRGQAVAHGVDRALNDLGVPLPPDQEAMKALRHLVERDGIGLSGVDFFAAAALPSAAQRRDRVLLQSLKDALDLLAGPAFARAFGGSTRQDDYRWGKLHRISFAHISGALPEHDIPGATPGFPPSVDGLPGIAFDGGLGTVDVSSHPVRAADDNAFMSFFGPNRRYVATLGTVPGSIDARSILPGGNSGVLHDRFHANMLGRWLTNETYPLRQDPREQARAADSISVFAP